MTITQLEYLVAVDQYHSFGKAADRCGVTQPTLSAQVKKLENELGVILFDRSHKPVITTEIGQLIVEQAKVSISEVRRIKEMLSTQQDAIAGPLRIGVIPTLSPYLLPLFILHFAQRYPQVEVTVEELLSDQIIAKLNRNELDVGLLVTPLQEDTLIETPLLYEVFVLYMSTNHPLSQENKIRFEDLDLSEMWLLKEGHCFRNQVLNICGEEVREINRNLRFESGTLETLRRIVEHQYGYTLLPELATLDMNEAQEKLIRYFKNPQPVREISLVRHRGFVKLGLLEALKKEILAHVPDILKNPNRGRLIEWK
jgi:LysR family hydrogen peroxide-inducible transcriptional activator